MLCLPLDNLFPYIRDQYYCLCLLCLIGHNASNLSFALCIALFFMQGNISDLNFSPHKSPKLILCFFSASFLLLFFFSLPFAMCSSNSMDYYYTTAAFLAIQSLLHSLADRGCTTFNHVPNLTFGYLIFTTSS